MKEKGLNFLRLGQGALGEAKGALETTPSGEAVWTELLKHKLARPSPRPRPEELEGKRQFWNGADGICK